MNFGVLFLVGLIFSAVGFVMYIYFFSVGYGLAIAAIAAALMIGFHAQMGVSEILCCGMLIAYGLRLGLYLLYRDAKNAVYRKVLNPERERSKTMPIGPKLAIWVSCALLYAMMMSPICFRLQNGAKADWALWAGMLLMACGIVLECVADYQKSAAKKKNSARFVDTGVYRLVRCPNYLGELILWTGVLLTGVTAKLSALQWIIALCGYLLIVFVMFSGARRLELRQDKNYGDDPAYQEYVRTVPIILPFVPLYSVKKYKFLVA